MNNSIPLPPLLPPIPPETSLVVASRKTCCGCNADLTCSKRTVDLQGRYHCPACWSQRVNAGTAIDLIPTGTSVAPALQQALIRALGRDGLAAASDATSSVPRSITVYVAPAPGQSEERAKIAFASGFYTTAGIAVALIALAMGVVIFFALLNTWQSHRAQMAAFISGPKETPILQEAAASAILPNGASLPISTVRLDAGVGSDSTLRVAAVNASLQPLKNLMVEVVPYGGAPIASLKVGELQAGELKTVFFRVPGLLQLTQSGQTVRIRAATQTAN